jgi:hypothetical protein
VRYLRGFLRFWYDFVVGDDWRIAAGVVTVLGLDAAVVAATDASDTIVALAGAAGIVAVVMTSIFRIGQAASE